MTTEVEAGSAAGAPVEAMPLELLEREITEQAAHINAATCRWLGLVEEFDRREGWADWGCKSCVHWLSYRCGLSPAAARDQVRVARLLGGLPQIRATFGRGELCYSQVRALTRVATPETEQDLLQVARHATAAQLEVVVRAYRGVLETQLANGRSEHEQRWVRCEHDHNGALLIHARLPAEEGALVLAALKASGDAIREKRHTSTNQPATGTPSAGTETAGTPSAGTEAAGRAATEDGGASAEATHIGDTPLEAARAEGVAVEEARAEEPKAERPAAERANAAETKPAEAEADNTDCRHTEAISRELPPVSNADALVLMAETLLGSGPATRGGGDSYQVVVHVDAAMLEHDADGACELEHGDPLHPETVRRLACDASLVRIIERDGRPLSIGRKTRSVPPALRRALRSRDRCCRFPGCSQQRFLHAHHIEHWAHGGHTDLTNLIQLCAHHHRLLHEGGYTIERATRGDLHFRRRSGQPISTTPPRPQGQPQVLPRHHHRHGPAITPDTCVPRNYGDRLDLHWVVDGLVEADPRFAG